MTEEIKLADNARLRTEAPAAGALFNAEATSKVWLWDTGPTKPKFPTRPEAPQGKEGTPAYDLAKIEFAEVLEKYQADLKKYSVDLIDYQKWERDNGGPVLVPFWSSNARDALSNDLRAVEEKRQPKRRWYQSSRTRGYEKLPNQGLPEGMTPGRKHAENVQREQAGDADMLYAQRRDPVFGEQELRQ